ncbi:hypothetical protein [uncultured Winogradskyella sp.]|uniref:hypothetical protein n=1 Tax=uncultured Winogradskyella sp. TaxID=395353 RepID=UPI002612F162|nr:hypothetical protein [uncultured Winogradskyella sp.]
MKSELKAIILLVAVIILAAMCSDNSDKSNKDYTPTSWDALRYSQEKIKGLLKSPSTAEFPSISEKAKHVSGSYPTFTINSWVDSENGFGAMIRSNYSCEVYYVDDKVGIRNIKID